MVSFTYLRVISQFPTVHYQYNFVQLQSGILSFQSLTNFPAEDQEQDIYTMTATTVKSMALSPHPD